MSKLLRYIAGDTGEEIYYPADIEELRHNIPALEHLPSQVIQKMYSDFSDEVCASWLILDNETIEQFKRWLS